MRLRPAFPLALAVAVLAAAPGHGSAPGGALPLETVSSPPPQHRADPSLRTYVFRVGPKRIGPYQAIIHGERVEPPPVAGSIVGMDVRLIDTTGAVVPQSVVMLHHIVFTDGGPDGRRGDGACSGWRPRERFYGTSEELRAMTFPRGYGYRIRPDDRWKTTWMLMNHRAQPRAVYIEYRVTVDPSPGIQPVRPLWLSVKPCSYDPQYTVPGGGRRIHRRSRSFRIPWSGRIVAIGGHLHGGSRGLEVAQPACGRRLFTSRPTYAPAGDPLYRVRPLLHEPDPKDMSWFQSATGWQVRRGERIEVTAVYDGRRPHMRVMGIAHVYVAPGPAPARRCAPAPRDAQVLGPSFAGGRREPPRVRLTLARMGPDGLAHRVSGPPGRVKRFRGDASVLVSGFRFRPPLLSIPRGATVRWRFRDRTLHDATVASGPRGFAAPYSRRGRAFRQRFPVPGTYRIYCSLHPVYMSQLVRVRRATRR